MILATLRATGLAAITAGALVGCDQTSLSLSENNDDSSHEQSAEASGGGGADSRPTPEKNTPAPEAEPRNTPPQTTALCIATPSTKTGYDGSVAAQISDEEDSIFNFSVIDRPKHGSLDLNLATGDFNYLPNDQAQGYKDRFSYTVDDLKGGTATGTVELIYGAARIMPLGNSITYGVTGYTSATKDQPSEPNAVGYRKFLYDRLAADGYRVDFVGSKQAGENAGLQDPDHQGLPGWTSWAISDALPEWLEENPADIVLAHIGTNDHKASTDGVNAVLNGIDNWASNNHSVKTLLATIVDQRPDTFFEDTVEDFNSNLTQLVNDSWSDKVDLVDQYSALDNTTDLTPLLQDSVGLHPNIGGYKKMAAVWFDALKSSGNLHKCP